MLDELQEVERLARLRFLRPIRKQKGRDALEAQVDVHVLQDRRLVLDAFEVEVAMQLPQLFAGQPVFGIELQSSAQRCESPVVLSDLIVAESAQGVLEDAELRQHEMDVESVDDKRHEEDGGPERRRRIVGERPQTDAESRTEGGHLHLRFLGDADERE